MNFESAVLNQISVHVVGNKQLEQHLTLSEHPVEVDDELAALICSSVLTKVQTAYEAYQFSHSSSLDYNEIYNFVKKVFENETFFHPSSIQVAQHLFDNTVHPKIKKGELYICHFSGCNLDGAYLDAIGIFKSESKNDFVEVKKQNDGYDLLYRQGIDLKKIEKGCLIFNTDEEKGYHVRIFDNQNRGEEAHYWKDDFLGLVPIANEYRKTSDFLGMTKEFISRQVDEEFEVSKADKIDLLNKSVNYFKSREEFSRDEFEEEVFGDENMIRSFKGFDSNYQQEHHLELDDEFEISSPAVKRQARVFKSVLKLDKNFHIYIHGDRNKIEKGVEPDGRKFYKVYYQEEK